MPSKLQALRRQAFSRQGGRCFYCGVRMWLELPAEISHPAGSTHIAARLRCTAEHLVPRSGGGRDTSVNIAAACAHCNRTRHRRKLPPEPEVYLAEVRRRVDRGGWHHRWVLDAGLLARAGWPADLKREAQVAAALEDACAVGCPTPDRLRALLKHEDIQLGR